MLRQFPVMYGSAGAQGEDTHGAAFGLEQLADAGPQGVSVGNHVIEHKHMASRDAFWMLERECVLHILFSLLRREVRLAPLEVLAHEYPFPDGDACDFLYALSDHDALVVAALCFTFACKRNRDDGLDGGKESRGEQVMGHEPSHGSGHQRIVAVFEFLEYAGICAVVMVVDER